MFQSPPSPPASAGFGGKTNTMHNLSHSFDKLKIVDKLSNARDTTALGIAIRKAISDGYTNEAIQMVLDQQALGHEEAIEWCIGRSTLDMINRLHGVKVVDMIGNQLVTLIDRV